MRTSSFESQSLIGLEQSSFFGTMLDPAARRRIREALAPSQAGPLLAAGPGGIPPVVDPEVETAVEAAFVEEALPEVAAPLAEPMTPADMYRKMTSRIAFGEGVHGQRLLRHGSDTRTLIQVIDRNGNRITEEFARNIGGGLHAEARALRALRARLATMKEQLVGGRLLVVVNQHVCPACRRLLRRFARDFQLEAVDSSVFIRKAVRGSRMAKPRAAFRMQTSPSVAGLDLKQVDEALYRRPVEPPEVKAPSEPVRALEAPRPVVKPAAAPPAALARVPSVRPGLLRQIAEPLVPLAVGFLAQWAIDRAFLQPLASELARLNEEHLRTEWNRKVRPKIEPTLMNRLQMVAEGSVVYPRTMYLLVPWRLVTRLEVGEVTDIAVLLAHGSFMESFQDVEFDDPPYYSLVEHPYPTSPVRTQRREQGGDYYTVYWMVTSILVSDAAVLKTLADLKEARSDAQRLWTDTLTAVEALAKGPDFAPFAMPVHFIQQCLADDDYGDAATRLWALLEALYAHYGAGAEQACECIRGLATMCRVWDDSLGKQYSAFGPEQQQLFHTFAPDYPPKPLELPAWSVTFPTE